MEQNSAGRAVVRPATEADVRPVAALSRQWAAEGLTRGLVRDTPRRLRKYLGGLFFVAREAEGELVGYVYGSIESATQSCSAVFEPGTAYLEIESLYVAPGRRGREIGSELLERLTAAAAEQGVEHAIVFSASIDWQRLVPFYARHGFKMWFFQMFK